MGDAGKKIKTHILVLGPKLLNEFIGTFFLVLVGCISRQLRFECVRLSSSMAIGSMLMVVVFMGGHISGGHYNPAVSLGVFSSGCVRGHIGVVDTFFYIVTQLCASVTAAICQWYITETTVGINRAPTITIGGALLVEALFSFILVTVVLHVATTSELEQNSFYGTAIGFTVIAGAIVVGQISGGVFNPAIIFGPSMVNAAFGYIETQRDTWLYYVGNILGALVAAVLYRITVWGRRYAELYQAKVQDLGVEMTPKEIVMNNRNPGDVNAPLNLSPSKRGASFANAQIGLAGYCSSCGRGCGCIANNANNADNANNSMNNFTNTNDNVTNVPIGNIAGNRRRTSSLDSNMAPNEVDDGNSNRTLLSPRIRSVTPTAGRNV